MICFCSLAVIKIGSASCTSKKFMDDFVITLYLNWMASIAWVVFHFLSEEPGA